MKTKNNIIVTVPKQRGENSFIQPDFNIYSLNTMYNIYTGNFVNTFL